MKTITIAGVPEHFNTPWKYAIKNKLFEKHNLTIKFVEVATGTGTMCRGLTEGSYDLALVLTEGIAHYLKTDPSLKIITNYVETPLNWGIHVAETSNINSVNDLAAKTFAISRKGSGSHLMVKLLAKRFCLNFDELKFVEVGDINKLCQALETKIADAFLWETFTTKPYLEKHNLICLDVLPTPWPCFQLVATQKIAEDSETVSSISQVIFSVTKQFNADAEFANQQIANFYDLAPSDIKEWLKTVRWAEKIKLIDLPEC